MSRPHPTLHRGVRMRFISARTLNIKKFNIYGAIYISLNFGTPVFCPHCQNLHTLL